MPRTVSNILCDQDTLKGDPSLEEPTQTPSRNNLGANRKIYGGYRFCGMKSSIKSWFRRGGIGVLNLGIETTRNFARIH